MRQIDTRGMCARQERDLRDFAAKAGYVASGSVLESRPFASAAPHTATGPDWATLRYWILSSTFALRCA